MKSFLLSILFVSSNALATGGTWCVVDDADVKFQVNLVNGRYFGSPIAGGDIKVEFKNQMVVGFAEYTFKNTPENDEIPYWFNLNNEMKFAAYAEPQVDAAGNAIDANINLSLVVEAKYFDAEEGEDYGYYAGTYKVNQTVYTEALGKSSQTYSGYVKCEID